LDASEKQQRQQAIQQQQNALAQQMMNEKIKNTIQLLSNGFFRLNSSASASTPARGFNYVRGAASSLVNNASPNTSGSSSTASASVLTHQSSQSSPVASSANNNNHSDLAELADQPPASVTGLNNNPVIKPKQTTNSLINSSSGSIINRETRIGATYAYVELANLLGAQWLERNLRLYLTNVLSLVNSNTKSVATHLDAGNF
jgi:hypothetical protein